MNHWFDRYFMDVASASHDEIVDLLAEDGLVTFEGIDSDAAALALATRLGDVRAHRDSDDNGVTHIAAAELGAESGFHGFSSDGLFVHTDRSIADPPPTFLLFWCEVPAEKGGDTLLVDGREVYEKMMHYDPAVFDAVTQPRSAVFASGESLYRGAIYERVADDRVSIRFRYDELLYLATPLVQVIPIFRGILDASTISLRLERGQGYILQNTRWLHGRRPFSGSRRCGRLHIDPPARERPQLQGFVEPRAA